MTKSKNNTQQALWVGIGSLVSFCFSIVSAAIVSRYLTKDEYGTYRQVLYVYNTLLVVFTLGLPRAYSYFLPRIGIEEGRSLINKLNLIFIGLGLIFSAALFFAAPLIADVLKNQNLVLALRIFSPTPLFMLPTMGLDGILATYRKTEWNAVYTILTRFLSLGFIVAPVVFYEPTTESAVAGFTAASLFICIVAFFFMRLPFRGVASRPTTVTIKEILGFSIPLMFAGFWGIVEKSADQFFISRWFGEAVFADFANGSIELPFVGMVLSAGAVVLLPLFSKMTSGQVSTAEIIGLWRRSAIKAAYILYPLVVFAWFFAEIIMTFLYGDEYWQSGIYFKIKLTVNIFTIAQYYPILLALGKTKTYSTVLFWSAAIVWTFEYLSILIFANPYLISIVATLVTVGKIGYFLNLISKSINCTVKELLPFKDLGCILAVSIVSCLAAYILSSFSPFSNFKLIIILFGFTIYGVMIVLLGRILKIKFFSFIIPLLKKKS